MESTHAKGGHGLFFKGIEGGINIVSEIPLHHGPKALEYMLICSGGALFCTSPSTYAYPVRIRTTAIYTVY